MSEYRLKAGHVTVANINADSAAVVTSFTGASGRARWIVAEPRIITPYAVREVALNGKSYGFGALTFTWTLAILNDAMLAHVWTTIMGGAYSADVTVKTRNRFASTTPANQWVVYNAVMTLPELNVESASPKMGKFYSNVVLTFTQAVPAAAS